MAHPEDDGSVAARRFAKDTPVARAVGGGDEWHDLLEQVVLVAPGGAGVDVLVAAEARETIGRGDDDGRALARRDKPIEASHQILTERIDVEQHAARTCEAH